MDTMADWGAPISGAPRWDPTAEGDLVGTLVNVEEIEVDALDGGRRTARLYTVDVSGGGVEYRSVWGSGILDRVLPDHVGHYVRIRDTGRRLDLGDGRQLHEYVVWCRDCRRG